MTGGGGGEMREKHGIVTAKPEQGACVRPGRNFESFSKAKSSTTF